MPLGQQRKEIRGYVVCKGSVAHLLRSRVKPADAKPAHVQSNQPLTLFFPAFILSGVLWNGRYSFPNPPTLT